MKPATLPRWAEQVDGTPAANIAEPNALDKDTGYPAGGAVPTSGGLNWLFRTILAWLKYLDGLANEALTWTAKHTFEAGLSSDVAPVSAGDMVRKADLDAAVALLNDALSALTGRVVIIEESFGGANTYSNQTTSTAAGAQVTLTPVVSGGGSRLVTLSYSVHVAASTQGNHANTGSIDALISLYRSIDGGAEALVGTLSVVGSIGPLEYEPEILSSFGLGMASGHVDFTDGGTILGQVVTYRAVISSRAYSISATVNTSSQVLRVVSVE